jgi:HAD superfamily hydrolase (TIGR01509 family)
VTGCERDAMTGSVGSHPPAATMAIGAILFDLDGVLVDTEPWWFEARRTVAGALGGRWSPEDEATVKGANSAEWAAALAGHLGRPDQADRVERRVIDEMLDRYRREAPPIIAAGVRAVRRLAGRYPLAVGSSSPRPLILAALTALDVVPAVRAVVSSDEVGRGKPAPDVYLEAARRTGLPPERCLVIEDSDAGVAAARAAGMRVVLVPAAGHPPGPTAHRGSTLVLDSLDRLDEGVLSRLLQGGDAPRDARRVAGSDAPSGTVGPGERD